MYLSSIKEKFLSFTAKLKTHFNTQTAFLHKKILKAKSSTHLSITAILISLITMYFQFFNVKQELLYAYLSPKIEDKTQTLIIPIVYKNNGNQNEMILNSNIEIEVKMLHEKDSYFKRIGDLNNDLFPIILAPGEMKTVNLKGQYKDYFSGMLEFSEQGLKYKKIDSLNNLAIKLTTSFLRDEGIENVERNIGKISFRNSNEYEQLDYGAISLMELKPNNNIKIMSNSIVNVGFNDSFSIRDSLSSNQIEYIKFLINHIDHPEIVVKLKELLDNNNIDY